MAQSTNTVNQEQSPNNNKQAKTTHNCCQKSNRSELDFQTKSIELAP